MSKRFISEQLLSEMSRPLINFIWYLWEMYCDPTAAEYLFILQPCAKGQRIVILHIDKTIEQDFGTAINATILIKKDGANYYMSRK